MVLAKKDIPTAAGELMVKLTSNRQEMRRHTLEGLTARPGSDARRPASISRRVRRNENGIACPISRNSVALMQVRHTGNRCYALVPKGEPDRYALKTAEDRSATLTIKNNPTLTVLKNLPVS